MGDVLSRPLESSGHRGGFDPSSFQKLMGALDRPLSRRTITSTVPRIVGKRLTSVEGLKSAEGLLDDLLYPLEGAKLPSLKDLTKLQADQSPMPAPRGFARTAAGVRKHCGTASCTEANSGYAAEQFAQYSEVSPYPHRANAENIINTDVDHCSNSGYMQLTPAQLAATNLLATTTIIHGMRSFNCPTLARDNLQEVFWRAAPANGRVVWDRVVSPRPMSGKPAPTPQEHAPPLPKVAKLPSNRDQHLRKYKRTVDVIPLTEGSRGEIVPGKPTRVVHRSVPTKEKKAQWRKNLARVIRAYHAGTEINDFFESLADAIPNSPCAKKPGFARAICVLENWDKIDVQQGAINLLINELVDRGMARTAEYLGRITKNGGPNVIQQTQYIRFLLTLLG